MTITYCETDEETLKVMTAHQLECPLGTGELLCIDRFPDAHTQWQGWFHSARIGENNCCKQAVKEFKF